MRHQRQNRPASDDRSVRLSVPILFLRKKSFLRPSSTEAGKQREQIYPWVGEEGLWSRALSVSETSQSETLDWPRPQEARERWKRGVVVVVRALGPRILV